MRLCLQACLLQEGGCFFVVQGVERLAKQVNAELQAVVQAAKAEVKQRAKQREAAVQEAARLKKLQARAKQEEQERIQRRLKLQRHAAAQCAAGSCASSLLPLLAPCPAVRPPKSSRHHVHFFFAR